MDQIEVTKLSSKGQIVLPQAIRRKLRLVEGETFMVYSDKDTVILKKIEKPVIRHFKTLLSRSRAFAKKVRLTQADVKSAIRQVRAQAA